MAETKASVVYLVGAGPGDPGLITVKGVECLRQADVVVYDYLANPELLGYAPVAAEKIYVGKEAGRHTLSQDEINVLLAEKAQGGRVVVRLKGGDPYVFGRGGEEALHLRAAGIRVEVVSGVTAAIAASAYAGIPVTHRDCTSVLSFITGHEDPTKEESAINWGALAKGGGTLAFYMGVKNLPLITQRLIAGGRSADTPVAVIRCGTRPEQQTVVGTLATIAERVREVGLKPPAITLVGEVVSLREKLNWFEELPLFGRRIVVTRSRTQASSFAAELRRLGAEVLLFPTIRIEPPADWGPLQGAVDRLSAFDWLVFTSVNAVDSFFTALHDRKRDTRALAPCRVCAIGPGTADALQANGVRTDLVPPRFTSEALFAALTAAGEVKGRRFLLPRADIAPPEFPNQLRAAGADVTEVVAYRTLPDAPEPEVIEQLLAGTVDTVTFTSSSTARNFAAILGEKTGKLPARLTCVSIGPETSRAVTAAGLTVAVEAEEHTIPGLVAALVRHLGKPTP